MVCAHYSNIAATVEWVNCALGLVGGLGVSRYTKTERDDNSLAHRDERCSALNYYHRYVATTKPPSYHQKHEIASPRYSY